MKSKSRRRRLVEKGGVEMFEVRIVQWFDRDGRQWTSVETTTPDGPTAIPLHEALGAMEVAKLSLMEDEGA
jgi:hypothetical protein